MRSVRPKRLLQARPVHVLLVGGGLANGLLAWRLLAARPPEPPAVVLAALPPAEHAAMRELWRARTLLLEDQRRFLASEVTPYR